jgi:pterin-4a-carbinolamine dehydratase
MRESIPPLPQYVFMAWCILSESSLIILSVHESVGIRSQSLYEFLASLKHATCVSSWFHHPTWSKRITKVLNTLLHLTKLQDVAFKGPYHTASAQMGTPNTDYKYRADTDRSPYAHAWHSHSVENFLLIDCNALAVCVPHVTGPKVSVQLIIQGPFEKFVDCRQYAAVMQKGSITTQQRRTAASPRTFKTASYLATIQIVRTVDYLNTKMFHAAPMSHPYTAWF